MPTTTITISYNEEKHPAMVRLSKESDRSRIVREAVHAYYEKQGHREFTLLDVMRAIEDLKRSGIVVHAGDASDNGDEPAEAVLALEGLGR